MTNKLHEPALKRLEYGATYDYDTIMLIFEELLSKTEENNPGTAHFAAMFIGEDDEFVPGTYVPEVWFVLRKVTEDDDQAGK